MLITFGQVELHPGFAEIRGERCALRVTFDADAVAAHLEVVRDVAFKVGTRDMQRVVFAPREAVTEGRVTRDIEPM